MRHLSVESLTRDRSKMRCSRLMLALNIYHVSFNWQDILHVQFLQHKTTPPQKRLNRTTKIHNAHNTEVLVLLELLITKNKPINEK